MVSSFDDSIRWTCRQCGGNAVQFNYPVWVDANDPGNKETWELDFEASPEESSSTTWCLTCKDHVLAKRGPVRAGEVREAPVKAKRSRPLVAPRYSVKIDRGPVPTGGRKTFRSAADGAQFFSFLRDEAVEVFAVLVLDGKFRVKGWFASAPIQSRCSRGPRRPSAMNDLLPLPSLHSVDDATSFWSRRRLFQRAAKLALLARVPRRSRSSGFDRLRTT